MSHGRSRQSRQLRIDRRRRGMFERLEEQILLAADLQLGISAALTQVEAGDSLTYELAHANLGDATPTGVELRVLVPANTAFDSARDTAGWDCGTEGIICSLAVPDPYLEGSVDFPVTVDEPLASRATLIQAVGLIRDDAENGPDEDRSNNFATAITDIARETHDLQASIAANLTAVMPGQTLTFTISYDNQGDATPNGARLRMNVPEHTTFVASGSSPWVCDPESAACTLGISDVAPADLAGSATMVVMVNADSSSMFRRVSAFVEIADDGTGPVDSDRINSVGSTSVSLVHDLPDLSVTLDDRDLVEVAPAGMIVYDVAYENLGTTSVDNVVVKHDLPADTTFDATNSTGAWTCETRACTLVVGTLADGAAGTAILALNVDASISPARQSVFSEVVISEGTTTATDADPLNNRGFARTPVAFALPDLTVIVTSDVGSVLPGDGIVYSIDYANAGDVAATAALIRLRVPAGTIFDATSSDAGWSCDEAGICEFDIGNVAVESSATQVNFAVVVDPEIPPSRQVIFTSTQITDDVVGSHDEDPFNNRAFTRVEVGHDLPDLSVSTSANVTQVAPGGAITFTINYENIGTQPATDVTITQTIPAGTTAAENSAWACTETVCTSSIAELAGSAMGSIDFVVTVDSDVSTIQRVVVASSRIAEAETAGSDLNRLSNSSFVSVDIQHQLPDLAVSMTGGETPVAPGASVAFAIGYANLGSSPATGASITISLPPSTTFNPTGSTDSWICVSRVCTLDLGALPAAGSGTADFVLTVNADVSPLVSGQFLIARIADELNGSIDADATNNSALGQIKIDHS